MHLHADRPERKETRGSIAHHPARRSRTEGRSALHGKSYERWSTFFTASCGGASRRWWAPFSSSSRVTASASTCQVRQGRSTTEHAQTRASRVLRECATLGYEGPTPTIRQDTVLRSAMYETFTSPRSGALAQRRGWLFIPVPQEDSQPATSSLAMSHPTVARLVRLSWCLLSAIITLASLPSSRGKRRSTGRPLVTIAARVLRSALGSSSTGTKTGDGARCVIGCGTHLDVNFREGM